MKETKTPIYPDNKTNTGDNAGEDKTQKPATKLNVLIAGVGGQGTLLASRILGVYADLCGYDCKLSEVHGMAQRGGSVVTYVKYDDKVYSPTIADGDADVLLAFEELEALRWSYMVKKDGLIIVNTQKIMPLPVITGAQEYPENIIDKIKQNHKNVLTLDALLMAVEIGNKKTVNTIMIGKLASLIGLDIEKIQEAVELSVPKKVVEVNLKALQASFKI